MAKVAKRKQNTVMIDENKEAEIAKMTKGAGKGAKSDLINKALEEYLKKTKETRVLSFINQKGGVGKTTSVLNVAGAMRDLGRKVLVVDADPQGNLTKGIGLFNKEQPCLLHVLKNENTLADVIKNKDGIDVVPSDLRLGSFEFLDIPAKEMLLKNRFENADLTGYDYILFDCAPNAGKLNIGALAMTDSVYVPMETGYFALEGAEQLEETVELTKNLFSGTNLEIKGVFPTMYDSRNNLDRDVLAEIQAYYGDKVMNTIIRRNTKLGESPIFQQDIFQYAKNSNGAKDYLALAKEILLIEEGE